MRLLIIGLSSSFEASGLSIRCIVLKIVCGIQTQHVCLASSQVSFQVVLFVFLQVFSTGRIKSNAIPENSLFSEEDATDNKPAKFIIIE